MPNFIFFFFLFSLWGLHCNIYSEFVTHIYNNLVRNKMRHKPFSIFFIHSSMNHIVCWIPKTILNNFDLFILVILNDAWSLFERAIKNCSSYCVQCYVCLKKLYLLGMWEPGSSRSKLHVYLGLLRLRHTFAAWHFPIASPTCPYFQVSILSQVLSIVFSILTFLL
jgi:hypothetical protein